MRSYSYANGQVSFNSDNATTTFNITFGGPEGGFGVSVPCADNGPHGFGVSARNMVTGLKDIIRHIKEQELLDREQRTSGRQDGRDDGTIQEGVR